ncbi:MAG TPA: hypothetical protein VGF53_02525 [Pseudolabrys sp.]|jgi:hypothetical protein
MAERRFVLVDFTYKTKTGHIRLVEAGRTHSFSRVVAHAATKRELVAKERPPHWRQPGMFRPPPEALTDLEVAEAEAELKALQRHALEIVDPETGD